MSTTLTIINGDVQVSSASGRPTVISDGAKLAQDILINLETDPRPNGFGAGISNLVGMVDDDDLVVTLLDNRLSDSFTAMRNIQQAVGRDTRPAAERIASTTPVAAARDIQDPRNFNYGIDVITEAGVALRAAGSLTRG